MCREGFGTYSAVWFVSQMDTLGRKYDQRFKAAGEVSSRLQAEEAAFRDIQVYHFVFLFFYIRVALFLVVFSWSG